MGIVYEAEQREPQRRIALKVLRPGLFGTAQVNRFRREWNALARLNHAAIACVFDAGVREAIFSNGMKAELPYFTTELIQGQNLLDHARDRKLDRLQRLSLFADICDAVHHAHTHGVLHRDLKPRNILVDEAGRPKVIDFGLARFLAEATQTQHTRTGELMGTARYMSPEQLLPGSVGLDERSDLYSLGIILFELLTGESPFGESSTSITSRVLWHERGNVPDVVRHDPSLRGSIEAIVNMALETDRERRYTSVAALGEDVRNVLQGNPTQAHVRGRWERMRLTARRHRPAIFSGVSLLGIAVVLFMGMKPAFDSRVQGGMPASNRLAILPFENMIDPTDADRRAEMLAELLITDLADSDDLYVVSRQRLNELQRLLDLDDAASNRASATELAHRANARWMMSGQILQAEPDLVITSQVIDVENSIVVASFRTAGSLGETLFSLADRIADDVRRKLALADTPPRGPTEPPAEAALRCFLEGQNYEGRQFVQEARTSYRKALEIDSTFAMAAYKLASFLGKDSPAEDRRYIAQARRHAANASWRDQQYIRSFRVDQKAVGFREAAGLILQRYPDDAEALEALTATAPVDEAIAHGLHLIEIDPLRENAYYLLAYQYSRQGDLDKALWACDRYSELAPNEPNVFDTRGEILAQHGRIDEAIMQYEQAVALKPDFGDYGALQDLGKLYTAKRDFKRAEAQFRRMLAADNPRLRAVGRTELIALLAYRGQVDEALRQIEAAITVDRIDGVDPRTELNRQQLAALLENAVGEEQEALERLMAAFERHAAAAGGPEPLHKAMHLARIGRVEAARQYLEQFQARIDSIIPGAPQYIESIEGMCELALGHFEQSLEHFDRGSFDLAVLFARGHAYFALKRWQDVIDLLEPWTLDFRGTLAKDPIGAALRHYHLGVAYQETGHNEQAAIHLQNFLEIWKDADPRLEGRDDAQRRLAQIRGSRT